MGLSKSKSTTSYNKTAMPYMTGAANMLQSTVNANEPALQGIASDVRGLLPGLGAKLTQANPLLAQAQGYAGDVLGGKWLNGSPQLDAIVGQARSNTMDSVNSTFGRTGMDFSSRYAGAIGRGLGEVETGLRYQDMNNQMQRMDQMAGLVPGLTAAELAPLAAYLQTATTAAELPYVGSRTLAAGMGGLMGNQTTTTQKPSMLGMILGAASNAAQAFAGGG